MRKEDLDRALGQTPQSFTEAMDRTLHGLKEEKDVKRVAFRTVILVAVIILLLCATAFALMGQGLEWYYNNIFTAYQEHEPEKHQAIMQNLQTDPAASKGGGPGNCHRRNGGILDAGAKRPGNGHHGVSASP